VVSVQRRYDSPPLVCNGDKAECFASQNSIPRMFLQSVGPYHQIRIFNVTKDNNVWTCTTGWLPHRLQLPLSVLESL
jgi:hypothetical protein